MADNKLSWTELRRALAARAGVSDKEANAFLNAFNDQLVAALKSDKQVKVNGLGTFKLQAVAPRKSVNVKTGEQITIEGYNKVAFVPEAGVKELVEKGVQSTEYRVQTDNASKPEVDPLKKLGAQAEEIVDILGELGQEVKSEGVKEKRSKGVKTPKKKAAKKPKVEEPKVEEPAPVVEPEPVVVPEPEPIVEPEPVVAPEPVVVEEPKKAEKPKKKYHFMRDTLICVVILLMLLLVGYFFMRNQLSGWINELVNPTESIQTSEVSIQPSEEPTAVSIQPAEEPDKVQGDEVQSTKAAWSLDEIMLTEEIAEGSRLAWIAKKHYGDKAYWPYIYAANKDRLTNPSMVTVGTPIRVPKLNAAMRDTTDVRFQKLKEEAYSALH